MRIKSDELLLMVLESVANDYEQLEHIADQIARWTETPLDQLDLGSIKAVLADAIGSGYIEAYELNPSAPHSLNVSTTTVDLDQHWFAITERGKVKCSETS